jgi:hypothetical protein
MLTDLEDYKEKLEIKLIKWLLNLQNNNSKFIFDLADTLLLEEK